MPAPISYRKWDGFYTLYRNLSTGTAWDQFGTKYDKGIIRTNNGTYDRDYRALQSQFNYRVFRNFQVGGTYTYSRLKGNLIGENTGSGPLVGEEGSYPEYRQESWNYTTRFLPADQRHRGRT